MERGREEYKGTWCGKRHSRACREHSVEGLRPCHTSIEAIGPAIIPAFKTEARIKSWLLSLILLEKGRPALEIRNCRRRSLSQ